ncbi:MAG TPA: peptidase S10, partial [Lapillicoccus sp.]|nr:peptidase S10 [Lapillicoccus sp.]
MPDDPDPETAPQLRVEPESQTTTETVTEVTKRPAEPTDDLVTTSHTLRIGRRTLRYTAVAGRLVLREELYEDGVFKGFKPKAEVSVTTYTVDDAKPAQRPVTFAFNGGPGSSSVWLHMGLFGPRRVLMGDVGDLLPPPYGLADNPESLLA